ncbi:hypothetical protein R1flu_027577 [Riccia fluitans]|uniref:Uncharacterized protein n=1 Tax=Riccia fluitans TaxID=41844 RepID=A0ABD1XJ86_9MARC
MTKEDLAYAGSQVNWSSFKDQEAKEAALWDGACFYLFQLQNSHITSQSTVSSFSHPSFSLLFFGVFRYIDWDFQFMSISGMASAIIHLLFGPTRDIIYILFSVMIQV